MKAKKLIEVALPIKEISAESVRDKSIRHGHISTLHLWWARRPLPVCRAIVFASLVPDPLDINCPQAFKDAVKSILSPKDDKIVQMEYKPYNDIPYTAVYDPMEDNLRNRLMMFIGKFSDVCQVNMKKGKATPSKDQLSDGSLIKWENKNNPKILNMARELIWVAYNSSKNPECGYETIHKNFLDAIELIKNCEDLLYGMVDRHIENAESEELELNLQSAIQQFHDNMPSVFDPFAGGGAIPLEAARLGCRSFGNDINPVAHLIERSSAEFPQKYGKPIIYTEIEFTKKYGDQGIKMAQENSSKVIRDTKGCFYVRNRLSFDVEFYANKIFNEIRHKQEMLYPQIKGQTPLVYYWAKVARCSNPSCQAEVPLLGQFYISKKRSAPKKDWKYLAPHINNKDINFTIENGETNLKPWIERANLKCPCCGSITEAKELKKQFKAHVDKRRLLYIVSEKENTRFYTIPTDNYISQLPDVSDTYQPNEPMPVDYTQALPSCTWGIEKWGQLFSQRQLFIINMIKDSILNVKNSLDLDSEYNKAVLTYLTFLIDRIIVRFTEFGVWHVLQETVEHPFGRQAIPMKFSYPEMNPFSDLSGAFYGQLSSILAYIEEENSFESVFINSSSGEKEQFDSKSISCVVTDPPYYDAIAYADLSDFFYVWQKTLLTDVFPQNFATPLTPKVDECTALKHRHKGKYDDAKEHFESKLSQIFDAIESQTTDIISIMFAHQSTEAWTTLCNSILGARMNITGSWPMDTEVSVALKNNKAFLESSVTVACRPSERRGYGDFKEVKHDIENKVTAEVESLYELGFRGADLLTACFGQAVSEFGRYKTVEKADGSEVSVGDLLEMARNAAFDALLKGIQGDDYTKFYIGWLQLNGTGDTDFDDATKFTRVGVNVDINDIKHKGILILEGNKMHLAMAKEHLSNSGIEGTRPNDSLISQAHRAILLYRQGDRGNILSFVRDVAAESTSPLWRLLATLKELLPASEDAKDVQGFLQNAEDFRQNCKKEIVYSQRDLFD